jgi:hypothetical protein
MGETPMMTLPFMPHRRAPLAVLVAEANYPFVMHGYNARDLREDVYDNAFNTIGRARVSGMSVFDIAMSGGEPYGHWIGCSRL